MNNNFLNCQLCTTNNYIFSQCIIVIIMSFFLCVSGKFSWTIKQLAGFFSCKFKKNRTLIDRSIDQRSWKNQCRKPVFISTSLQRILPRRARSILKNFPKNQKLSNIILSFTKYKAVEIILFHLWQRTGKIIDAYSKRLSDQLDLVYRTLPRVSTYGYIHTNRVIY